MAGKSGSGDKPLERLGVREIAKRVGVAPMTVSRVLSNPDMVSPETRAKVLRGHREGRLRAQPAGLQHARHRPHDRHGGAAADQFGHRRAGAGHVRRMPGERLFDAAGAGRVHPGGGREVDPDAARLAAGRHDPAKLRAKRRGARAAEEQRRAGGRDFRDQGAQAARHGGRRLQLRDGLCDDHASRGQGLQAHRLRLDADPWQRPAAAAPHRLSCRAVGTRHQEPRRHGGRGADHRAGRSRRRWSRSPTGTRTSTPSSFRATRWRSARSRNAIAAAGQCPAASPLPAMATWIWRRSSSRR